ncbi:FliM/FliN family flagellar motor switch protein [Cedecea davisae]|uniref:FliM/FliN family flagellar motor switch protein n=1 Tax=Cedecea davisae TaxID=158484 RepID=UPI00242F7D2B|nr:FliM/FliN family flagellar motor switch protein [Cedecea davisae]
MIAEHLRRYSSVELAWQQHILRWNSQGFLFQQNIAPGEALLHFVSDAGWEGVIDLQEWFARVMPQSANMASSSWSLAQLEALFLNATRPLEGLPEELEYHQLASKGLIEGAKMTDSMYSCQLPHGRVWFCGIPENLSLPKYTGGRVEVGHLPIDIHFEVGHSFISLSLLKRVKTGDLLLVNNMHNLIFSAGKLLGKFIRNEDGFMFEDENDFIETDFDEYETNYENEDEVESKRQKLMSRDKVLVKLGFVLQQTRISIDELESLYQGKVLPCQPDAEKNVTITANGVAIARGEVVWVEDRLGIEVKELYQGPGDDPR